MRLLIVCIFAIALLAQAAPLHAQKRATASQPSAQPAAQAAEETATPPGLPAIGKWMIDRYGTAAHWLGEILDGKRLHEPINVIFIDAGAASAEDARKRLFTALIAAGYPARFGHSTGYRGNIGGVLYGQLPHGRDEAFSNRIFEESNNHGRIFGPHPFGAAFVFIAAFSRERVNLFARPAHRYASFNRARDDLARATTSRAISRQATCSAPPAAGRSTTPLPTTRSSPPASMTGARWSCGRGNSPPCAVSFARAARSFPGFVRYVMARSRAFP